MGGRTDPVALCAGRMVAPKFDAVDPHKDAMADMLAIRSGIGAAIEAVAGGAVDTIGRVRLNRSF